MQKLNNIFLQVFLMIGTLTTLIISLNRLSIQNAVAFVAFQVFGIIVPGIALTLFLKIILKNRLELVAVGYALGYCLNIVLYFFFVPFGLQRYLALGLLLLIVLSVWIIYTNRIKIIKLEEDCQGNIICCIISIGIFGISLFSYTGMNLLPHIAHENEYYNDVLYWIGNTISLIKGFPPVNFRNCLEPFNYHYLSSIQLGVQSIIMGIRPAELSFCYSIIQSSMLLAMGAYYLFHKITNKTNLIIMGMVMLFFTTGKELWSSVTYVPHMYIGSFGLDYGLGITLFALAFFIQLIREPEFKFNIYCITLLLFAIALGTKVPYGAVFICGVGTACIGWLITKNFKKAFGYGVPLLLSFILVYLFIVNYKGYGGTTALSFLNNLNFPSIDIGRLPELYFQYINMHDSVIWKTLLIILYILAFCILSHYSIFIIFFLSLIIKIFFIKKFDFFDIACMVMVTVGVGISLLVSMYGLSQMYFMMVTYPIAISFNIKTLDIYFTKGTRKQFSKILGVIISIMLLFGIYDFWNNGYLYLDEHVKKGIENYTQPNNIIADKDSNTYVSKEDYEAYVWLRDNTETNDICISNRTGDAVGVFSERYILNHGQFLELFEGNNYVLTEELGVVPKYILYEKEKYGEKFELSDKYSKIVFENNTFRIYQLNLKK